MSHDPACQGCERCCMAAPPSLTVFGRRFEVTRRPLRFGASAGGYGVGGYRTPWGALIGLRRWSHAKHGPVE